MADEPTSDLIQDRFLAPLEEAHSPGTYVRLIFTGWGAKIGGAASLILTLGFGLFFETYAALATGILYGIYIYVVGYQLWKAERQRSDALVLRLGAAKQLNMVAASDPQPALSGRSLHQIDLLKTLIARYEDFCAEGWVPLHRSGTFTQSWTEGVENILGQSFDQRYSDRFNLDPSVETLRAFVEELIDPQDQRSLLVELKDFFLSKEKIWDFDGIFFFTIELEITNTQPTPNTIKRTRLFVTRDEGEIEGEFQRRIFMRSQNDGRSIMDSPDPQVLRQGVPCVHFATFRFNEDDNWVEEDPNSLSDEPFTVVISDSFSKEYKVKGRTSKTFVKDAVGAELE